MSPARNSLSAVPPAGHFGRLEAIVVLMGMLLIVLTVCASSVYFQRLNQAVSTQTRVAESFGEILRLDELLTMSARLYTSSRDEVYKRRYFDHVPMLELDLSRVKSLAPEAAEGIALTDDANGKLVALEEEALRLCDQSHCSDGYAILHSAAYRRYKEAYATGIRKAFSAGQKALAETTNALTSSLYVIQVGSIINCLFVGLYLFRVRRRLSMQKVTAEAALRLVDVRSLRGSDVPERPISRLVPTPIPEHGAPVTVKPPPTTVVMVSTQTASAVKRILVVEDDPTSQAMLQTILEKRQFSVVVTSNGAEGLESLSQTDSQNAYAAVLMDIQMPVMDGITALREIRAAGTWWSRVPVIAVTGQAAPGDRERLLAVGFDSYVSKPVNVSTLMKEIALFTEPPADQPHLDS